MMEEEKPILTTKLPTKPGERTTDQPELPKQGMLVMQYADCEAEGGMVKVGRHRHHEVWCDEPATIGGDDKHPQPLTYICMGVGF